MLKKLIIDFTPAAVVQDVKTILSEHQILYSGIKIQLNASNLGSK
jgi:hypothetical protein